MVLTACRKYYCPSCKRYCSDVSTDTDMFKCGSCGGDRLSSKTLNNVSVKALMEDGKTIFFSPTKVDEYFKRLDTPLPGLDKDVSRKFLTDNATILFHDNRKNCVGFKD